MNIPLLDRILKHFDSKYTNGKEACQKYKLYDLFDCMDD